MILEFYGKGSILEYDDTNAPNCNVTIKRGDCEIHRDENINLFNNEDLLRCLLSIIDDAPHTLPVQDLGKTSNYSSSYF